MASTTEIYTILVQTSGATSQVRGLIKELDRSNRALRQTQTASRQFNNSLDTTGTSLRRNQLLFQNFGYQVQDVFVQVAGGTSAFRALGQQIPQMTMGMGLWGVALGTAVAAGGALIPVLFDIKDSAKEAEKATETLGEAISGLQDALEKANTPLVDMVEKYGEFAAAAGRLNDLQLRSAFDALTDSARAAKNALSDSLQFNAQGFGDSLKNIQRLKDLVDSLGEQKGLGWGFAPSTTEDAETLAEAIRDFESRFGLTIEQAKELRGIWAEVTGMMDEDGFFASSQDAAKAADLIEKMQDLTFTTEKAEARFQGLIDNLLKNSKQLLSVQKEREEAEERLADSVGKTIAELSYMREAQETLRAGAEGFEAIWSGIKDRMAEAKGESAEIASNINSAATAMASATPAAGDMARQFGFMADAMTRVREAQASVAASDFNSSMRELAVEAQYALTAVTGTVVRTEALKGALDAMRGGAAFHAQATAALDMADAIRDAAGGLDGMTPHAREVYESLLSAAEAANTLYNSVGAAGEAADWVSRIVSEYPGFFGNGAAAADRLKGVLQGMATIAITLRNALSGAVSAMGATGAGMVSLGQRALEAARNMSPLADAVAGAGEGLLTTFKLGSGGVADAISSAATVMKEAGQNAYDLANGIKDAEDLWGKADVGKGGGGKKGGSGIDEAKKALEDFIRTLQGYRTDSEQASADLIELEKNFEKFGGTISKNKELMALYKRAVEELKETIKGSAEELNEFGEIVGGSFDDLFGNLISGTQSVGESFRDMLTGMLNQLSSFIFSGYVQQFLQLLPGMTGSFTLPGGVQVGAGARALASQTPIAAVPRGFGSNLSRVVPSPGIRNASAAARSMGAAPGLGGAPVVNVYDNAGVAVRTQTSNRNGTDELDLYIEQRVAHMADTGALDAPLQRNYGTRRRPST